MGSAYVSPMLHASYHNQGRYVRKQGRKLPTKPFTKLSSSHFQLPSLVGSFASQSAPTNTLQISSPSAPSLNDHGSEAAPLTLSKQWRQIQGENHWEGLLDHPIDSTLRAEIIRYGEFAQVCYDAFDFDQHSLYCGSCKYNRKVLFEKVDKSGCGYEVTKYLYATSKLDLPRFFKKSDRKEEGRWSRDSNWIGYVAVCTDEDEIRRIGRRDILIAWRGTVTTTEWVDDLMIAQAPANIEPKLSCSVQNAAAKPVVSGKLWNVSSASCVVKKDVYTDVDDATAPARRNPPASVFSREDLNEVVKVETGFLSLYSSSKASSRFNKLSAGQQMALEVKRLLQEYEGEKLSISITGHSLGAALALLCAYDIAANLAPSPNSVTSPLMATQSTVHNDTEAVAAPTAGSEPTIAASRISSPTLLNRPVPPLTTKAAPASPRRTTSRLFQAVAQLLAPAAMPARAPKSMAASFANEAAAPPEVGGGAPSPPHILITVYSFGGPRVGNRAFKRRLEEVGVRVLRIVNVHDCVPKMPGFLFNERSPQFLPSTSGYHHVGKELFLDFDFSPHLRKTRDLASHHNLEAHLHVLDGFHGLLRPFRSVFGRNPVLVNKSSNFLQKGAFIPPYWWQESNKGLVKDPLTGEWALASREDDHLPEIHHPEVPQVVIGT